MADLKAWAESIIGKTIADRYDVSSVLGMGGNGGVFLARHKLLGDRAFAVKLIIPNPLAGPMEEQEQRLAREAATALAFVHPRAVQVRDFGFDRDNDVMYMAMDHVEGTDLSVLLAEARSGNAPGEPVIGLGRALIIIRMVLDVLETAETANVVHRDLKPSNIILTRKHGREDIKVLDFGLAKVVRVAGGQGIPEEEDVSDPADSQLLAQRLTASGAIMGTVQYMAPEQARGDPVDSRADIYSAGVILYEMLTGKLPHEGANYHHLLFARAAEPAVPIGIARPDLDLPSSVRAVLDRALAMAPGDRFRSASEFATALEGVMVEMGVDLPAATGGASRKSSTITLLVPELPASRRHEDGDTSSSGSGWQRRARRRRIVFASLVSAGILAVAAGALFAALWHDGRALLVDRARACLEKDDVAGAMAALDEARRSGPLDDEAEALMEKARAAAALGRAREAADAGDLAALEKELDDARDLGAEAREFAPLVRLAKAGRDLARAEHLLGERSYVRAKAVIASLPGGLPAQWAERAGRVAASADSKLARARALLGAGRAQSRAADPETLRAAESALGRFLDGFPYHPSREEALGSRKALVERLRSLRGGGAHLPATSPTALRIETHPAGLVCRLDGRVIGRTPLKTSETLEPGPHLIEFVDTDGFVSRHEVDVVRGRMAHHSFDHASAVAGERTAFAKAVDSASRSAGAASRACRRYLSSFPRGAMRAEVARILRSAERRAFEGIETLWRGGEKPELGIERAEKFAEDFHDSARAGEVAAWLEEWRRVAREMEAESRSRERLGALLVAEGVTADAREKAFREHLGRFTGPGAEARARGMLAEHLVRPLPLSGRLALAVKAGPGVVAVAVTDPAVLAVIRLASGETRTAAIDETHVVVALAAAPDGSEVYAATTTGVILRWRPSLGAGPEVVATMPRAPCSLVALGSERVVVADGVRGRALALAFGDGDQVTRGDFAPAVGRPVLGTLSADGSLVAFGGAGGRVTVLAVEEGEASSILWRARVRGPMKALAFSPRGRLLAASSGDGGDGTGETVVWSVKEGPVRPVARHGRSSGWTAFLDDSGLLVVGGTVVGPESDARPVPLRVGAACVADGESGFLLAATAGGEAVIADLRALVRRVRRTREKR